MGLRLVLTKGRDRVLDRFNSYITGSRLPKTGIYKYDEPPKEPYGQPYGFVGSNYGHTLMVASYIRSNAIASVPIRLYDANDNEIMEHPIKEIIVPSLIRDTETDFFLEGRAYWRLLEGPIDVRRAEKSFEIHYIPQEAMFERRDYISDPVYSARYGGGAGSMPTSVYPFDEIITFRRYKYVPPYELIKPIIDTEIDTLTAKGYAAKDMIKPRFKMFFEGSSKLTPDKFQELLDKIYGKDENDISRSLRKDIILDSKDKSDIEIMQYYNDPELYGVLQESRRAVAMVSSVPAPFLGSEESNTYNNVLNYYRYMWETALLPEMRYIENTINEQLLRRVAPGLTLRFDIGSIEALRVDEQVKAQTLVSYSAAYRNLVQANIMSVEEARDKLVEMGAI